jgi:hypothetical protein
MTVIYAIALHAALLPCSCCKQAYKIDYSATIVSYNCKLFIPVALENTSVSIFIIEATINQACACIANQA